MFRTFRNFIDHLEKNNDLRRIKQRISTDLEITEISRRFLESDGEALLFENVIKCDGSISEIPVITNLYASQRRILDALGLKEKKDLRELGELLAFLRMPQMPSSLKEIYKTLPIASRVLSMKPSIRNSGSVQDIVIDDPDIDILPIQKCWPDDISPLITWPLIVTKSLHQKDKMMHNLGIYRMQPIAKNKLIMRWLKMRGGASHFKEFSDNNTKMPVAAVLGANPAITMAAVMPIPSNLSEYGFAGLLQNKSVELVKCKTIDLYVPAHAEIVIEGFIDISEYAEEGPFGDHTGYYNEVEKFPVMTITAITMQKSPIYLSTYTGRPPDEPSILACALNEVFIPLIKQQFPEIHDFYLPPEACSYRVAVVSISKKYPGHARRVMMGVWSYLTQFSYVKYIIIVDNDINVRNWSDVMWAISTRSDPERDTEIINNTPIDYLDFASRYSGLGSKMGIDATNKIGNETQREWGKKIEMRSDIIDKIDNLWTDLLK